LKIYPKVHLESQKTKISQGNTEQKEQCGVITIPDFKLYYKATAIKSNKNSMVLAQKQT
jgi:hypothetical protein